MTLFEVRDRLEEVLYSHKARFKKDGVLVSTCITYQNDEDEECAKDDKRLNFICGELHIKAEGMSDDDSIAFIMVVAVENPKRISEKELSSEIEDFAAQIDTFLPELETAEDAAVFLTDFGRAAEEDTENLIEDLNNMEADIERTSKIETVIAFLLIIIVAIIILIFNN